MEPTLLQMFKSGVLKTECFGLRSYFPSGNSYDATSLTLLYFKCFVTIVLKIKSHSFMIRGIGVVAIFLLFFNLKNS